MYPWYNMFVKLVLTNGQVDKKTLYFRTKKAPYCARMGQRLSILDFSENPKDDECNNVANNYACSRGSVEHNRQANAENKAYHRHGSRANNNAFKGLADSH